MGAYGYKLYDSDEASDLKARFNTLLNQNQNVDEITKLLIDDNQNMINDSDEAPIFWCVIADLQWDLGRLNKEIKEKAIYYLKNGFDLERWKDEDESSYKKRKQVADKLLEKLESPQPASKKIRIKKPFVCDWKIGDVFAYKLEKVDSLINKGVDMSGNYVIFQKINEKTDYKGDVLPIVRFFVPLLNEIDDYIDCNCMEPLKILSYNSSKLYRVILQERNRFKKYKGKLIKLENTNVKLIDEDNVVEGMISWEKFNYWIYTYRHFKNI